MQFQVSGPEAVDPGTYRATLLEVEEIDSQFGRRLRWTFELPDNDGHRVSRFTSTSFAEKSKATETVAALFGRRLERGERFDREDLIGRTCTAFVTVGASGWNQVEKLVPATRRQSPVADPAA